MESVLSVVVVTFGFFMIEKLLQCGIKLIIVWFRNTEWWATKEEMNCCLSPSMYTYDQNWLGIIGIIRNSFVVCNLLCYVCKNEFNHEVEVLFLETTKEIYFWHYNATAGGKRNACLCTLPILYNIMRWREEEKLCYKTNKTDIQWKIIPVSLPLLYSCALSQHLRGWAEIFYFEKNGVA